MDKSGLVLKKYILTDRQFKFLAQFIEKELGIRMPDVKRTMLESRLQKRLKNLKIDSYDEYLDRVFGGDDIELIQMIDVITTNKTDFFREADHFDILVTRLLPHYTNRQNAHCAFWSAGCATGEEPYSLAMVLEEYKRTNPAFSYNIVASDISAMALSTGIDAVYHSDKTEPIPASYKKRYLLKNKDLNKPEVRIKKELRDKVDFLRLNLMDEHYPFKDKFDIIFCRNVIIYFDRSTQYRILYKLCNCLSVGGYLLLGHSETLTGMSLPLMNIAPTVYERI